MRVSSSQMFEIARKGMADANQALNKTQQQISTGRRVQSAADDPVAATKILQLTDQLNAIGQYNKNINIAENNLELEETVLGGINSSITRLQELAVSAGNTGTLGSSEYQAIASEVGSKMDELMSMMNTKNANGDYIFGGHKSSQPPFSGSDTQGFQYHGDEGQLRIKVSASTTVAASDSGKALFVDIPSAEKTFTTMASSANRSNPPAQITVGQVVDQEAYDAFYPEDLVITFNPDSDVAPPSKNFTAVERSTGRVVIANQPFKNGDEIEMKGVSVRIVGEPQAGDKFMVESSENQGLLTTVSRLRDALKNFDNSPEGKTRMGEMVASTLKNLGKIQESVSNVVTEVGARRNTLDTTREIHLDTEFVGKEALSQLRDLDLAEASTRMAQQSLILEAAQQAFIRASRLSLINKL